MDDQRYQHHAIYDEPDTVVIDPREDVVMQVFCAAKDSTELTWHRLMPNHQKTACGAQFNAAFSSLRRQVLADPLCRRCFTVEEIDEAEMAATQRNPTMGTTREWLDEQQTLAAARIAKRKPRRK